MYTETCPRHRARARRAHHLREPFDALGLSSQERAHHGGVGEAVLIVAALAGVALTAYGQYQSAQYQGAVLQSQAAYAAQQAQYATEIAQYQADALGYQARGVSALAEAEAAMSEFQATAAEQAGKVRAEAIRRAGESAQGEVRAAIGASGVDTTGSPLMVLMSNADRIGYNLALNDYQTALDVFGAKSGAGFARAEGSLRAGTLGAEAALTRFGGSLSAYGLTFQSLLDRSNAGFVRRAGALNAGSTLLTGAGTVGLNYLNSRYPRPSGGISVSNPFSTSPYAYST